MFYYRHTVKQIRRVCLNPAIQVQISVGPCCCFILHYCNIIYTNIIIIINNNNNNTNNEAVCYGNRKALYSSCCQKYSACDFSVIILC